MAERNNVQLEHTACFASITSAQHRNRFPTVCSGGKKVVSALRLVHSRSTAPRFVQKLSGSELIAKRHYLAIKRSRLRVGIPVGSAMAIWDTHPRNSMGGIPVPPLHSGPRPSRISQTPRCCHLGRQGTRAACVMGAGNKDAQDPEPRPPSTSHPSHYDLFFGVSMPDCPRFPELPQARPGAPTRVGHAFSTTGTEKSVPEL